MSVPPSGPSRPMRPPRPPGPPGARPFRPPTGPANFHPQAPMMLPGFPGWAPPPMMPNFPPPLPPGWSEHLAPDGVTRYYYNSSTKQSTYIRPTFVPLPPTSVDPTGMNGVTNGGEKKKKEKPKDRVPIPNTTWTRVTTTEGNVFYFEKESKRSEWTVPDEIKDAVEAFDNEEKKKKEEEQKLKKEKERLEKEKVRLELEEERKRLVEQGLERKRKAEEAIAQAKNEERKSKVAKTIKGEDEGERSEEDENHLQGDGEEGDEGEDEEGDYGPVDEDDEAAWQRAVAAEFAEADAALEAEREREKEETEMKEEEAVKQVFSVPEKVTVSLEEGKALFKEISPFAPWDQSLPLFINDPRYVLLSSLKDRREVYEEYCRDVGRARRLNKIKPAAQEEKKSDPEREYKALLRDEVTSTRTRWEEFRKKWKKERRFYAYGRDDREREKIFKVHLRELGERKRADAQRAEQDFLELLHETPNIAPSSIWQDVKKSLVSDKRYDAVGSSSLREELFDNYRKTLETRAEPETPEQAAERKLKERKAREEASLREREARVRGEKIRVDQEMNKSRIGAGREEGEREFGSLLVDQVRDHDTTWESAIPYLSQDPRFSHPSLRSSDKQRLFTEHISHLSSKRSSALHALFSSLAPALDTPFESIYAKLIEDPLVVRLALGPEGLEERYNAWRRAKETEARREFDVMLGENSFVEFWGRMRKKAVDDEAAKIKDEEMEPDEEDEAGKKNMRELAQQIDLDEIKAVLRRDKRYRIFDHVPEKRESWIRDYMDSLSAASGSETIHHLG
ncbi:hypothetical protein TREMEDRAFT_61270 [Tremella mesenterica DSM 1558]|uniref:uncharacterized protein n=1 Tax=Tremella mesenterica (strain ATCC 24925 / CBS 8224 / DSM 1558 / NBRC 9311 / NRRL Y-6157 / RJB 2259-6 / UBC 559-6) TaxID=578456 RepID=UPI0003F49C73|nr:uncharacterized protein TREMEDRAFT_61270 [Tremella mesenterica DSM 1558]EIW70763.1 hypothetical protein TREMEDRAFT_61270 [Tremella mesenterica DSM 1558]